MKNNLRIGLFGFGCVGQGLYDVLHQNPGFKAEIVKIAIKDPNKTRTLPAEYFTVNKFDILDDINIDVIVELIDDYEEAFQIVQYALKQKKHVVTANKRMLAYYLPQLQKLQQENNVSLLYEASSCGSIPIIRQLEEYYDNDRLKEVRGIFNGTTNYMLTQTIEAGLSYQEALQIAQQKGFAESDPANDVEGFDAKFKAIIIAQHAFGITAKVQEVLNIGITTLSESDIRYAQEKNYRIKLVPTIQLINDTEVSIYVVPKFVEKSNPLYNVADEFNGIVLETQFSGLQFLFGKGAGGHPTGSAVLSDISALQYDYRYEYKKQNQGNNLNFTNHCSIKIYYRFPLSKEIKLPFSKIEEQYRNTTYGFIIGEINIETLINNKAEIIESGAIIIGFD
jgi:homoserine dehydrogenase